MKIHFFLKKILTSKPAQILFFGIFCRFPAYFRQKVSDENVVMVAKLYFCHDFRTNCETIVLTNSNAIKK